MKKLFAVLVVLASVVGVASAEQFSLTTGFDYTTGKYGNAVATDILYIPVTGKYESGKLMLRLTVPYIRITGPDYVTLNGRFTPTTASTTRTTHSGLGDVIAAAGYTFYSAGALELEALGKIKFGTADAAQGLGTGKDDYAGQLDAYYTLGRTMLFGTAGYKIYGTPVAGIDLTNAPYYTLGVTRKFDDMDKAGMMLTELRSNSIYVGDQKEAILFYAHKFTPRAKLFMHLSKGLTDSSPARGLGATMTGYF